MATDIPWNEVRSSNLAQWRYDSETKVLEIQFIGGNDTYSYDDVPEDVADGFKYAPSAGKYFHDHIKNRYKFYKG